MTFLVQNVCDLWSGMAWSVRIALLAWIIWTVATPIVQRVGGDRGLRWSVMAGVILQACAVVTVLASAWGWGPTALVALAVMVMSWGVEFVGSHTGAPFGRYHYTGRLQPQLGRVPLLIPAAWLMMLPAAWAVADLIAKGGPLRQAQGRPASWSLSGPAPWILSGLAFTAWDLFLDPQMVGWRLWVWERRGGYFGIPWVNFLGWTLSAAVMTAVTSVLWPGPLPTAPLVAIYVLTWLLETVGLGVFWRQPKPALCGFVGMGGMLLWAWLSSL